MARSSHPLRCVGCRLHPPECICEIIGTEAARLRGLVRTRVVIVLHAKERSRSTNTGFLAARLLPGCELRVRGAKDHAVDLDDLGHPDAGAALLFPAPEARVLTADPAQAPRVLVVPDGSWRQAASMVRRDRVLSQMERVALAPGPPPGYRLRTSPRPGALCTLDAIARALALLEGTENGPAMQKGLETVLDAQVQATLRMRGRA
jgi:tRNA-uridine aminocarboxypropyltransferase